MLWITFHFCGNFECNIMVLWNDAFHIPNSKQIIKVRTYLNILISKKNNAYHSSINRNLIMSKCAIQDIFHDQLSVNTCYTKINYNIIVLQTWQYMSLVESNKKYTNDEKNVGEPDT